MDPPVSLSFRRRPGVRAPGKPQPKAWVDPANGLPEGQIGFNC